jgi:hypothetical protein
VAKGLTGEDILASAFEVAFNHYHDELEHLRLALEVSLTLWTGRPQCRLAVHSRDTLGGFMACAMG